jgi:hypothetical protein
MRSSSKRRYVAGVLLAITALVALTAVADLAPANRIREAHVGAARSSADVPPPETASAPSDMFRRGPVRQELVDQAQAIGAQRAGRAAVAVYDRMAEQFMSAGDVDAVYAAGSVMKVFIAARLLTDGRSGDPVVARLLNQMIVGSDDAAASRLYGMVGGPSVATWAAQHYGIGGIEATPIPRYWGLTRITARAMVHFYLAVAEDPAVGPWLLSAMGAMTPTGTDGFPQNFGIAAVGTGWRVKQSWMCCLEQRARMHTTGFVNADRYAVAVLTEGRTSYYGTAGRATLTAMATTLLAGG